MDRLKLWGALVPAIALSLVFILGLFVFAIRCAVRGVPRDAETAERGASVLVGFFLRYYFFWLTKPVFNLIVGSGIPPAALTFSSAVLGAGSGIAVAAGHFALGGWLFILSGILDAFDGRLARSQKNSTLKGAAMDSILDRYTDSFVLIGLAWYYRGSWVLLAVLATLLGSAIVPYVRARGEGLGVAVKGGLMQRLERVLILGSTLALSPILQAILFAGDPAPRYHLAIAGILLSAITTNTTAVTRTLALLRALSVEKIPTRGREPVPAVASDSPRELHEKRAPSPQF